MEKKKKFLIHLGKGAVICVTTLKKNCEFFDNELDKGRFYQNNQIIDFVIIVKKGI